MKSLLKAFSAVALTAVVVPAYAGTDAPKDTKDYKKMVQDAGINYVETAQKGITLSGYVDTSYTEQFAGPTVPFVQPFVGTPSTANLRQFDNDANGFNLNAVKLALEKALPDKNDWAAGFRIDLMAGSDAKALGATDPTLNDAGSGFYVEQALVKFRVPVGNGLDIYMGKFVTFLGYEVIESPANLNFSRGLLFTNAIPLTHTGIYGDYKFNDMFEAKFGVVDGWNNSSSPVSLDPKASYGGGGKAITGQLNVNAPGKNANICQSFIYSPDGSDTAGGGFGDNGPLVVYDIWGNWNPTFVKDSALTLGFNGDYGYNGATGIPAFGGVGGVPTSGQWYGVALYSKYQFNKVVSLAGRLEWLHETPNANKFPTSGGETDDYSGTLTASFAIWDNLLTRLEYRHDILQLPGYGDDVHQDEITAEAVYSF